MIGVDTNILVRYFARDVPEQWSRADRLINSFSSECPGYISQVALVETVWVLTRTYGVKRPGIAAAVNHLLSSRHLVLECGDVVVRALRMFETVPSDFSDCLIYKSGVKAACRYTLTFDKAAAQRLEFKLLH